MIAAAPVLRRDPKALSGGRMAGPIGVDGPRMAALQGRRIGPNALTRVAEALVELQGPAKAEAAFAAAGLTERLRVPPTERVPAREAAALNRAVQSLSTPSAAAAVRRRAGGLLAAYLLAHRIPVFAQRLIRLSPPMLGKALLFGAMRANAETFGAAGAFSTLRGREVDRLRIENSALAAGLDQAAAPVCDLFAGCFEGLLRRLISDRIRVREVACAACGDPACVFEAQRLLG